MLKDKVAIITGSRSGIGFSCVETFAKNRINTVFACARKYDKEFEDKIQSLSKQYAVRIVPIYFDLSNANEILKGIKKIKNESASIDVLVNVAGIVSESSSFLMSSIEKVKSSFNVNFFGPTLLTQYVSRIMTKKSNGSIVNVSSIAALDGDPAEYDYCCSKAAILGAVKKLSQELAQFNIRVNAVAPGIIDTDMSKKISKQLKEKVISQTFLNRMGTPTEIANVIAFFASDLSSYVTGQVIRVDGGM